MTGDGLLAAGELRPIDPLRSSIAGVYRDELVRVRAAGPVRGPRRRGAVRTQHFDVARRGDLVDLTHVVAPDEIDDDLAGLLAGELFGPGWLRGPDVFERVFTGIVLTSRSQALACWELFYRNTLARIDDAISAGEPAPGLTSGPPSGGEAHGTIAGYAPVYAHTSDRLAPGSVLELGSCFGFLSLLLAVAGREVIATDVSPGTIALIEAVAPRLDVTVSARVADATVVPAPDRCADNVVAIHLLEHLDAADGSRVVAEAVRLARRRVVIAVPLEDEPNETWGHLRTVTLTDLRALGRATGHVFEVHEYHGGWLVVDVDSPL